MKREGYMKSRVSPTATSNLINTLNRDQSATTSIKYLFRNGADPWAVTAMGSSVLDLCLRDGRPFVASAWAQAAREHLKKSSTIKNPMADTRVVDLVAGAVYLEPQDRQEHMRRFLFNPQKVEDHHEFICKMFTSRNPQIWPVIANMLLLRPHLHSVRVPEFLDKSVESDFFADDVDIVLYNYLKDRRHVVELDWTKNDAVRERLRLFLSSEWAHQWKDLPGFSAVLSGVNAQGETPLHHYLRSVPVGQISVEGLEVLLASGNSWHQTDKNGVNSLTLLNNLLGDPSLSESVREFVEQSAAPAQSVFRPFN